MTRSSSVILLGTLFANVMCLLGLSPLVAQEALGKDVDSRPNVILIMTDDQGYGDMSCHGNPYIKTPNLDRLHDEAIRFSDFHVDPTCSPTRAALMTGRYSSRTGVWLTYAGRHHLRRDETTMADVFSSNGYRTAIFGKWHLGDNYPFRPHDRGFDESLIHGGGVIGEAPDTWVTTTMTTPIFVTVSRSVSRATARMSGLTKPSALPRETVAGLSSSTCLPMPPMGRFMRPLNTCSPTSVAKRSRNPVPGSTV